MPHKLLLADDSVTIQRVIELTFADEDIQVIAVGDGKQAIEKIQSDRPDIVLADIGMPERDGYEVAAFVKGHPDMAHVPVLLLTGAFEPIDEGRARAAGCDGVLVKPFEPQMVINRVKDLLAGRRPAGLWAAATLPQPAPPARPSPPLDLGLGGAAPAGPTAGGSLEDYFDRLDAAFADTDASTPVPAVQGASPSAGHPGGGPPLETNAPDPGDVLAGWDPDLAGDPPRPSYARDGAVDVAPARTIAPPPAPQPAATSTPSPQPAPTSTPPPPPAATVFVEAPPGQALAQGASLAEAFAALLSAEQGQTIAPSAVRPEDITDATIEDIVQRVIDRMGTDAVRQTVLDVAERLVREEIDRIKRGT
jgi:CheY-like chemotaxis protein